MFKKYSIWIIVSLISAKLQILACAPLKQSGDFLHSSSAVLLPSTTNPQTKTDDNEKPKPDENEEENKEEDSNENSQDSSNDSQTPPKPEGDEFQGSPEKEVDKFPYNI